MSNGNGPDWEGTARPYQKQFYNDRDYQLEAQRHSETKSALIRSRELNTQLRAENHTMKQELRKARVTVAQQRTILILVLSTAFFYGVFHVLGS